MTEIAGRVVKVVRDQLSVEADKAVPTANFKDDLGADSLDMAELAMAFEEEFEIEIDDAVAEKIATIGDAILAVEKLLAEKE